MLLRILVGSRLRIVVLSLIIVVIIIVIRTVIAIILTSLTLLIFCFGSLAGITGASILVASNLPSNSEGISNFSDGRSSIGMKSLLFKSSGGSSMSSSSMGSGAGLAATSAGLFQRLPVLLCQSRFIFEPGLRPRLALGFSSVAGAAATSG